LKHEVRRLREVLPATTADHVHLRVCTAGAANHHQLQSGSFFEPGAGSRLKGTTFCRLDYSQYAGEPGSRNVPICCSLLRRAGESGVSGNINLHDFHARVWSGFSRADDACLEPVWSGPAWQDCCSAVVNNQFVFIQAPEPIRAFLFPPFR